MEKTKRQLRAEAAGRLSGMKRGTFGYMELMHAAIGWDGVANADVCRDALVGLLADDEPRVNNLTWLYNYDEVFAAGVDYACKYVSGFGIDCDNEREWLLAEHAEVVLNAKEYDLGPEFGAESCTEKAGRKSPPEGGPGPCGQPSDNIVADTREKLEADYEDASELCAKCENGRVYDDAGW